MIDDRDPLGGRHLFETLTRRSDPGQWDRLSDTSKTMWEHRAAGRPDFVPSNAVPHRTTQKIVSPAPAPEQPAALITAGSGLWEMHMPGGAKQIVKLAEKEGWLVAVSYCMGPWSMQTEHEESDEGDDVLTKYGQADSILVRGRRGSQRFAAMWLRKPWTKAGQKAPSSQGAGGYAMEYAQIRPAPPGDTAASGGTEIGKDGKSHRVPTDLVVDRNGKVSSDELKAFLREGTTK